MASTSPIAWPSGSAGDSERHQVRLKQVHLMALAVDGQRHRELGDIVLHVADVFRVRDAAVFLGPALGVAGDAFRERAVGSSRGLACFFVAHVSYLLLEEQHALPNRQRT